MADYYVDPAATGAANGSSWTDAWTSIQTAIDTVSAGDVVYCRGTESPSVAIDVDGTSGSGGSYIRFIGANSGGTVDGTRYVLDWSTNACHGLSFNDKDNVTFENFELVSSQSAGGSFDGVTSHTGFSTDCYFINCYVHGWPRHGINAANLIGCSVYGSRITNNDSDGINGGSNRVSRIALCTLDNNGNDGANAFSVLFGCICRDNGRYGAYCGSNAVATCVINNVFFNNTNDALVPDAGTLVLGNRFADTGGAYHIDGLTTATAMLLCNYFDGSPSGGNVDGDRYIELNIDGTGGHNEFSGSDTDDGFVDSASDDYNIDTGATLRSQAITLLG